MPDEIAPPYHDDNQSNPRPELSAAPASKKPIIIGLVFALVILLILGGLGWYLFSNPDQTAILRDIVIIFMGLGIVFIILLLIALIVITAYLVIKVNDLVQLLDREIRPVLTRMQKTLATVSGTATFLSDQAIQPVISTASTVAAVQTIVRSLFRRN
jgi:hypothetical protein